MSYTAQPISIIINHKFITPPAISTLGDFSLSQNRQPILAQPNFHTFYKSGQCSSKHKLFSDLLVSYNRWDLQPHIHMKISRKYFTVLIWQTIKKCQLFFETPGITSTVYWVEIFSNALQWSGGGIIMGFFLCNFWWTAFYNKDDDIAASH